jgi:hypothetical protein
MAADFVEDFARRVCLFQVQDDEKLKWMNVRTIDYVQTW